MEPKRKLNSQGFFVTKQSRRTSQFEAYALRSSEGGASLSQGATKKRPEGRF
jgi:hypothetical protein